MEGSLVSPHISGFYLLTIEFCSFGEYLISDMNKQEKLENARNTLKKEFIGIDHIIDQLINSITPWYITPEVLEKPLVISLWGITGTGKTSILRRLFELLEITKILNFDSGELIDKTSLSEMITSSLSLDEEQYSSTGFSDMVFIFDEFQHARTIDEHGSEITKATVRQMWNLIDNGFVTVRDYNYRMTKLSLYIEDLEGFSTVVGDIPLNDLTISDPGLVKQFLDILGPDYSRERAKELMGFLNDYDYFPGGLTPWKPEQKEDDPEKKDPLRPIRIIPNDVISAYLFFVIKEQIRKGGESNAGDNFEKLRSCGSLKNLLELLSSIKNRAIGQKQLDFSKSIVFLVGNLDEAFYGFDNLDPDMNADLFKQSIDKVTIPKIKDALKSRFRAEQIARFGNTIIKYSAFSTEDYRNLIKLELGKQLARFENSTGIKVEYTENIVDLLYSEGVFPTQGARPVFSSIYNIVMPILSTILKEGGKRAILDIKDPELGYRLDEKTLVVGIDNERVIEIPMILTLGSKRNPKNNPLRYAIGVHEAGHAVANAFMLGAVPVEIVATAARGGGHCSFEQFDFRNTTRELLLGDMVGYLGGLEAEKVFFQRENGNDWKITLGAEADLREVNICLRNAINQGLLSNFIYVNKSEAERLSGVSKGFADNDEDLCNEIKRLITEATTMAYDIVRANKKLVAEIAWLTAERGLIDRKTFLDLVKKHENDECSDLRYKLTLDNIETAKLKIYGDFYKEAVMKSL